MTPNPLRTRQGLAARRESGLPAKAFFALRGIHCGCCGRTMPPGTLFTYHGTRQHRRAVPVCWLCFPFSLERISA